MFFFSNLKQIYWFKENKQPLQNIFLFEPSVFTLRPLQELRSCQRNPSRWKRSSPKTSPATSWSLGDRESKTSQCWSSLGVFYVGQNLRYLFCRDYHLFQRLLRVTGGTGFWPIAMCFCLFNLLKGTPSKARTFQFGGFLNGSFACQFGGNLWSQVGGFLWFFLGYWV